ncbi:PaaX family transcriptional regulator C-terminal domain-containing protein [Rhodococcus sp. IEGM 1354]|uniref:PaaX family transcriptional regulator n=1 Tax=Rhodococcus sp. IEGM 1354 TaxID=3047088 RepID=UPI0024B83771|nr:PaaX family transcriptional regulator C-terminal domain-containing protein [Rhodococcus sp. IEGM 1354]MDI9933638.1 PaaX family transcriptional regulator C-terminal domain-containing protein [Rhodococcus sp. IEGM 1354]
MKQDADVQVGIGAGRDTRLAQLILTIFGLCARSEGNWLSVASVVSLMGDLGMDGQAVRSSISRLKRRGVLCAERHGGAAGYSLSESTLEVLAEGDVRIFHRKRAAEEDGWVVVAFSVPESERDKRHALRSHLTRLGFGTAAPGVWIAPGTMAREARHTLDLRGLSEYVDMFSGNYIAFGDLHAKIRTWWDLDELTSLYADFLEVYRPVLHQAKSPTITPCEAFQIYVPMLTQWRRLPYRDPGIPLSLLPPAWNGEAAGALFDQLNELLNALAHKHAFNVVHGRGSLAE